MNCVFDRPSSLDIIDKYTQQTNKQTNKYIFIDICNQIDCNFKMLLLRTHKMGAYNYLHTNSTIVNENCVFAPN